jgi:hypothetical protein
MLALYQVSVWSYLYANRASYTNPLYSEAHSLSHTLNAPITIAPLLVRILCLSPKVGWTALLT